MNQNFPLEGSELETRPDPIQLAILKVAGGDPNQAATIRTIMWHAYLDAGSPHGATEEGCFRWWREELELVDS